MIRGYQVTIVFVSVLVLADTLERARAIGVTVALLPPWYDVDTPQDLRLLRLHVALDPSRARVTAARLGEM
ncbi:MAG: hypothetical protein DRJ42_01305 [Deltaproteobacteria bacterium]|nr:MAG: hypothetical protein DRJ42_01305 [Deltaproteobacteria bacterium]